MKRLTLAVLLFTSLLTFAQQPRVNGYYCYWMYAMVPPEKLDMGSLSHITIFMAEPTPNTSPYLNVLTNAHDSTNVERGQDTGQPSNYLQRTISLAHAKGVKVILSLGGEWGSGATNMRAVASDVAKTAAFVKAASLYAQRKGLDGLEINWEWPLVSDRTAWNRLIAAFRAELDTWPTRGILATCTYWAISGANDSYFAWTKNEMVAAFDIINIETYAGWSAGAGPFEAGYDTPVNVPTAFTSSGFALSSPNNGPLSYINAGYPKNLLWPAFSGESSVFTGSSGMGKAYSSWMFGLSVSKAAGATTYPLTPATGRQWDAQAQASYVVSGGKAISFQDTTSISAIVGWIKDNGFAGVMVYNMIAMYDASNPVPDANLKKAASIISGGVVPPPPPPPAAPSGTFTATPSSLPSGGGSVNLSWTSVNATSVTIGGVQMPLNDNQLITVSQSISYTLSMSGPGGNRAYSVSITVASQPPPPPPVTFTAADTLRAFLNGFTNGVSSVDTMSVYNRAFTSGYNGGFVSGAASIVCPPAIHDTVTSIVYVTLPVDSLSVVRKFLKDR